MFDEMYGALTAPMTEKAFAQLVAHSEKVRPPNIRERQREGVFFFCFQYFIA
jgi:hypothetical protein